VAPQVGMTRQHPVKLAGALISPVSPGVIGAHHGAGRMFDVLRSLIDLIAEIVGGVLRLVATFISSCFGLVITALLVIALVVIVVLHVL